MFSSLVSPDAGSRTGTFDGGHLGVLIKNGARYSGKKQSGRIETQRQKRNGTESTGLDTMQE